MEIIKANGIDIRSWCPEIESEALAQMVLIAQLPYVKECCLMPDAHFGMDMPIGGVVATDGVVVPNMVGSDVGCGMCAIKTNLTVDDLTQEVSQKLFNSITRDIPVGFNKNSQKQIDESSSMYRSEYSAIWMKIFGDCNKQFAMSKKYHPLKEQDEDGAFFNQLGTLGGGNHFIEVQCDTDGYIWVMIHSGSRNIGKLIGDHYNEIAIQCNKIWHSDNKGIPFLAVDSEEGQAYLKWMEFALQFAFMNRKAMMNKVAAIFERMFNNKFEITTDAICGDLVINIHHNYAALENHHGHNVWVHRKGATKATNDTIGIIPGSMGTASYITKGLGNHLSLQSSSHGAGRLMGRKEFSRRMKDSYDEVEKSLEGVIHSKFGSFDYGKDKGLKDVSEAPAAYKDIDDVMDNQKDLVDILVKLTPKISIKG